MTDTDRYIASVADLLRVMQKPIFAVDRHAHLRIWFRGHSKLGWELKPGVYRPPFPLGDEADRLLTERHLTQDFRAFSANLRNGSESDEDIYFLQQHYRMPTRLLDWTTNPLAGLHFAVDQPDSDGELFMMDAYRLAVTQGVTNEFRGIATARNRIFRDAVNVISNWRDDENAFPKYILPVRPGYFDQRIVRQHAYFTFHVPQSQSLTAAANETLTSFRIPAAAKTAIRTELALLGVNEFTIFGDLDHLAEWLKQAHKNSL